MLIKTILVNVFQSVVKIPTPVKELLGVEMTVILSGGSLLLQGSK